MPLTNGSGSCNFRRWSSKSQQKTNVFKKNFCLLLFKVQYRTYDKRIRIREAQNHVDPVDPDPDSDQKTAEKASSSKAVFRILSVFVADPDHWINDPDQDPTALKGNPQDLKHCSGPVSFWYGSEPTELGNRIWVCIVLLSDTFKSTVR